MTTEDYDSEYDGTQTENPVEEADALESEEVQETKLEAEKPEQEEIQDRPPKRNREIFDQRIKELTWHWREAEERASAAQAAYMEKVAEVERLKKTKPEQMDDDEQAIKELLEERKKATAEEDFGRINDINDRLSEARTRKLLREIAGQRHTEQPTPRATETTQRAEPNPAAQAWIKSNPWYNDPEHAHLAAIAYAMHNRLIAVDHYPVGEELYRELDRKLRELPDFDNVLYTRKKSQEADDHPARSHVVGPSRGGIASNNRSGRGDRLSAEDVAIMIKYHLDPTDKKHVEKFLKYRVV